MRMRSILQFPSKTKWVYESLYIANWSKTPKRHRRALKMGVKGLLRRSEGQYSRMWRTFTLHYKGDCYMVNCYVWDFNLPMRTIQVSIRNSEGGYLGEAKVAAKLVPKGGGKK